MNIEHHHARLADVSLHYASAGEGVPVVLVHGWPSTWYEWRHVMPLLAGCALYGILRATIGLRLSQEQEFEGADLSIHRIGATPDREVNW